MKDLEDSQYAGLSVDQLYDKISDDLDKLLSEIYSEKAETMVKVLESNIVLDR